MNRKAIRIGIFFALPALLMEMAAVNQRRRLTGMRAEIAALKMEASKPATARPGRGRSEEKDGHEGRPGAKNQELSMAGEADIPKALAWVVEHASKWRANPDGFWIAREHWPADLEPLEDLLAGMGAGAMAKLMADPALGEPEQEILRRMFARLNPEQALLLAMSWTDEDSRRMWVSIDFGYWRKADPAAAAHWFREMEASQDSIAKDSFLARDALAAEAEVDPVRAVAKLADGSFKIDAMRAIDIITAPQDVAGKIAMMNALNAAKERFAEDPERAGLWKAAIYAAGGSLIAGDVQDGAAVLGASFTPEQQRNFAVQAVRSSQGMGPRWAPWILSLDLPVNEDHPLVMLGFFSGSLPDEPTWLNALAPGELRDLVITSYAHGKSSLDPKAAAPWLEKLPAGEKRRKVAEQIAEALERQDAEAAAALRESEGLER